MQIRLPWLESYNHGSLCLVKSRGKSLPLISRSSPTLKHPMHSNLLSSPICEDSELQILLSVTNDMRMVDITITLWLNGLPAMRHVIPAPLTWMDAILTIGTYVQGRTPSESISIALKIESPPVTWSSIGARSPIATRYGRSLSLLPASPSSSNCFVRERPTNTSSSTIVCSPSLDRLIRSLSRTFPDTPIFVLQTRC